MGYLNRTTLTVDAILTKKGRELLSKGQDFFNVTQFALSDDEVDYGLWNENHPSGSSYYGYAIEQMPVIEPIADETQIMKYKLVSLPKDTVRIPVVTVGVTSITLLAAGDYKEITPSTVYSETSGVALNATLGYTCILHNSDLATLIAIEEVSSGQREQILRKIAQLEQERIYVGASTPEGLALASEIGKLRASLVSYTYAQPGGVFLSDAELAKSVFVTGKRFRVTAKSINTSADTKLTVVGNESGGSATISLTVHATPRTTRTTRTL